MVGSFQTFLILVLFDRFWLSINFQKIGLTLVIKMQGVFLQICVKKCFKRMERSCRSKRSSTISGKDFEVLTALAVYGATAAWIFSATFFKKSH